MGSGNKGLYSGTYGSQAVPGSTDYMKSGDSFSKFIRKRKDVDLNGFYDIIAHGSPTTIQVQHNGATIEINHRVAAKLFLQDKNYHGGAIRLLSCSTGKLDYGFAQNLSNKLNIPEQAPTDLLWAKPHGQHYVTGGKLVDGKLVEDPGKKGKMKTFYPKRRKNK